jgi:hypothetical protein
MHAPGTHIRRARESRRGLNRQNLTRWQERSSTWRVSVRVRLCRELSLGPGVKIRLEQVTQKAWSRLGVDSRRRAT